MENLAHKAPLQERITRQARNIGKNLVFYCGMAAAIDYVPTLVEATTGGSLATEFAQTDLACLLGTVAGAVLIAGSKVSRTLDNRDNL